MLFRIAFCSDQLEPRKPEASFQREVDAAGALGIPYVLTDHDALDQRHDAAAATKRIRGDASGDCVYRGWMLRAEDYRALYDDLLAKNIKLINTPEQYSACHHVPEVYPFVAAWAARTAWIDAGNIADETAVRQALSGFGNAPVVLKDWVKSQAAGYWTEACFIPDASDAAQVRRVVDRFLELQGTSLVGGLVFRAYAPLARSGGNIDEWRAFVLDNSVLGCWPRSSVAGDGPPKDLVASIAKVLPSRFATIDFARKEDGEWLLLETGDGQVSELPAAAEPDEILAPLAEAFRDRA